MRVACYPNLSRVNNKLLLVKVLRGEYYGTPVAVKRIYASDSDEIARFIDRELSVLRLG